MNDDLRRLTLAVAETHDAWFGEPCSITPAGAEEIVHTVLEYLKALSGSRGGSVAEIVRGLTGSDL